MNSVILEARSLTKEYKQTLALDHINLQIKKGKIYGFIGHYGENQKLWNYRNSVNGLEV